VSGLVFPETSVGSELPTPLPPVLPPEEKVVPSPVLKFVEVTSVRKSMYIGEPDPSPPPERTERISFAFDSVELSLESRQSLNRATELMRQSEGSSAFIAGYSDSEGNAAYNHQLSQTRAAVVADYLISRGVQEYRLEVEGRGIYYDPDDGVLRATREVAERARMVQIIIRDASL
jgi:outer membrane protein OmpA-like peptidoglycan-associated protein